MTITLDTVQSLAPDQASLNAAKKLLKPAKWPVKQQLESKALVWGHCQGSGANPYYTVFDTTNHGYKCTCPSRKFPCKHVLALMWQYSDDETAFTVAELPQWVSDWLGRRRNNSSTPPNDKGNTTPHTSKKSIAATEDSAHDSVSDGKRQAAAAKSAAKRKAATDQAISAGLQAYEQWLNDQLRTGLMPFLDHASERCRNIAARLVDAKATTLAARLDELPAKLMHIGKESQLRVATNELGKIVCLVKAWQNHPDDPDARRAIGSAENRDSILDTSDAIRQQGIWQVVAEQVESRRDGLISHATWLRYLGQLSESAALMQPTTAVMPFALLQDYYPAKAGRRSVQSTLGSYLFADMVYYPSRYPLRAVIETQQTFDEEMAAAVATVTQHSDTTLDCITAQQHNYLPRSIQDFYRGYQQALAHQPWLDMMPCLLPHGRIKPMQTQHKHSMLWWQADVDMSWQLPLRPNQHQSQHSLDYVLACPLAHSFVLWDGVYATLGSGYHPNWGQISW